MIAMFQGWCSRSTRRAIVVRRASRTVELTLIPDPQIGIGPRQPVDRARAVENAKSAFPTSSLHAHRTRAHTLHRRTRQDLPNRTKRVRSRRRNNVRRMRRPIAVVASLR